MRSYRLSEFAQLLRLGLWIGGEIEHLGYASPAREAVAGLWPPGLSGLLPGYGVMLERSRPEPLFSVYDPYSGSYRYFTVYLDFTPEKIEEALREETAIGAGTGLKTGMGKSQRTKISDYTPLRDKRRYMPQHTSYRSGPVPMPGKRR